MSANYDPETDSHPVTGEGGTDYAAVPQVASAAEVTTITHIHP